MICGVALSCNAVSTITTNLESAVAVVLGFIGSKLVAEYFGYNVPTEISLGVVATLLGGGVAASLLLGSSEEKEPS